MFSRNEQEAIRLALGKVEAIGHDVMRLLQDNADLKARLAALEAQATAPTKAKKNGK